MLHAYIGGVVVTFSSKEACAATFKPLILHDKLLELLDLEALLLLEILIWNFPTFWIHKFFSYLKS